MTDHQEKTPKDGIAGYASLIQAADGFTLGQVCALSGLEQTTVQNWIKRGFVPHPVRKKYHQRHLARILLIDRLRESMRIDRVGELLTYINGDADDESDDLLPEEDLYDIFYRVSSELEKSMPPPEKIPQLVRELIGDTSGICSDGEKLIHALTVMGCTHISNVYKRRADSLFREYCQTEQE